MTQDEIIRMAREAGFDIDEGLFPFEAAEDKYIGTERTLERFAAIAFAAGAAHEREACAKVCDTMATPETFRDAQHDFHWAAGCCAAAIRARGKNDCGGAQHAAQNDTDVA